MAKILSSKEFFITKTAGLPLDYLQEWFDSVDRNATDCHLIITLKSDVYKRQKKHDTLLELANLVGTAKTAIWKYKNYHFNFMKFEFEHEGTPLHFTVGEALFLFKWLVQGDKEYLRTRWYCFRDIQKRFGKDFLAEVKEKC